MADEPALKSVPEVSFTNPLEDLLTRALARQTPKKERRKAGRMISPEELAKVERRLKALFTDPANWTRKRHVALIHEESDTLLGNFAEYVHNSALSCRKLLRVEGPVHCDAAEYVRGSNWLAKEFAKVAPPEAVEERPLILDLHLRELGVYAPHVLVLVKLEWGGVARVELEEPTRFLAKDGRTVLELPEGIDVLEVMSLECKLKMKEELDQD